MKAILDEAAAMGSRSPPGGGTFTRFELGLETRKLLPTSFRSLKMGPPTSGRKSADGVTAVVKEPFPAKLWPSGPTATASRLWRRRAFLPSKNGRMHACGHDATPQWPWGRQRLIAHKNELAGTVKFIFQPGRRT